MAKSIQIDGMQIYYVSLRIQKFPNTGKYEPEITLYLHNFHAVIYLTKTVDDLEKFKTFTKFYLLYVQPSSF